MRRIVGWSLFALLLAAGCGKIDLSAPPDATLALASERSVIPEDGSTGVVATVLSGDGSPVDNGTLVFFFTSLGSIDEQARTSAGLARATLSANGQTGTAVVTAVSGAAAPVSIEVLIGLQPSSLSLSANPTSIPEAGGVVALLATVRSETGAGLPGQTLLFSATPPGQLASGGAPVETDSQGRASDTLTTSGETTVSVSLVGSELSQSLEITTAASPVADLALSANPGSLPTGGGSTTLTAVVFDAAAGPVSGVPVSFETTAGSLSVSQAVSNSSGEAFSVLATSQGAVVTASAEGLSESLTVSVGAGSVPYRLTLSFTRSAITDPSDPGPSPCQASQNPQLPVRLVGQVSDLRGDPRNGVRVELEVEDLGTDPYDGVGFFCVNQAQGVSVTSGSAGAGRFELLYSLDSTQLADCAALSGVDQCSATLVGSGNQVNSAVVTLQVQ